MRPVVWVVGLALVAGCSDSSPLAPRARPRPALGSSALPQHIQVGERVNVAAPESAGGAYHFMLVAPADGTLVLELSWDAPDCLLHMQFGDTPIGVQVLYGDEDPDAAYSLAADGRQSLTGSVGVSSGDVYRMWVANVRGPWDYGSWIDSPFTLTTRHQKD